MKLHVTLAIACALVALVGTTQTAHAAHCYAYAAVSSDYAGHTNTNDSDDQWGWTCYAHAQATCGGCAAFAATDSQVTFNNSSGFWLLTGTVTPSSGSPAVYPNHTARHTGSYAHPWEMNAHMIGQGALAQCQLLLNNVQLAVPASGPGNMRTAEFVFDVPGGPSYTGAFTLSGDGSHFGMGAYEDAHFNVYLDADIWRAEYIGPASLPVELPVNSDFIMNFHVGVDGQISDVGYDPMDVTVHTVTLAIPEEFELLGSAAIPTTSQWGLAAMLLIVLVAGTVVFARRRAAA